MFVILFLVMCAKKKNSVVSAKSGKKKTMKKKYIDLKLVYVYNNKKKTVRENVILYFTNSIQLVSKIIH